MSDPNIPNSPASGSDGPTPGAGSLESLSQQERAAVAGIAKWWWVFLISAVIWAGIAFILLQFTTNSLATVGFIIGAMLLFSGIEQFMAASAAGGAKWLFWIFGVLFMVVGVIALFNPLRTAASVAASLGFIFGLIGILWALESIMARRVNPLWWFGLIAAALMIGMGIWLGNQGFTEKVVSLLVFAGFWALLQAFTDVVRAFQLKKAGQLVASAPRQPVG